MKRSVNVPDQEPEESNFKLPAVKEHLFQVTDVNSLVVPTGENENIQVVSLEIVGGDDNGSTILMRVGVEQTDKSFYYARLFLKAIGEPYKGVFDIDTDNWIGRQFYATVKHTKSKDGSKTYANIDQYNFDKMVDNKKPVNHGVKTPEEIAWEE